MATDQEGKNFYSFIVLVLYSALTTFIESHFLWYCALAVSFAVIHYIFSDRTRREMLKTVALTVGSILFYMMINRI